MESCCLEGFEKPVVITVQSIPTLLQPAPQWSGTAVTGFKLQTLSLRDFKGRYLVFIFYPYDFTFMCPTELIEFSERINEFQSLGADVVATSTDSEYSHLAWVSIPRKQGGLGEMKISILADKNQQISKNYGVLNEKEGISLKAVFIIDKDQLIRHITLDEIAVPRSVDEILRLIRACKFIDNFGHRCPKGPDIEKNNSQKDCVYFNTL